MSLEDEINFDIDVNKSRFRTQFIILVYVAASAAIGLSILTYTVKIALLGALLISGLYDIRKYFLSPFRLTVKHTRALGWQVSRSGEFQPVSILASTMLTPFVIILHFRNEKNATDWIAIFPDCMSPRDFRKLTVSLKLYGL